MTTTVAPPLPAAAPTVEPPRTSTASRYGRLLFLVLIVAFGVRLVFALTDNAPSTDETAYLQSGLSLWEGDGFEREGRAELHFPPGLPFVLGGVAQITGDAHEATVIVTLITGTLLLLPLAAIGRRVCGDRAGLAAALVAAFCPALTTLLVDGGAGSEAPYTLALATALWLALRLADLDGRRRIVGAGALGALLGVAYLIRPEALAWGALFVPIMVVPLLGGWKAIRARKLLPGWGRRAGALVAAFAVVLAVFVAPYVVYLHENTGKWQFTAKTQDASLIAWRAVAKGNRRARDRVLYKLDETGLRFAARRSSLAALAAEDPLGYLNIVRLNIDRTATSLFASHFRRVPEVPLIQLPAWVLLPPPLLLLGAWAAWRNRRNRAVLATLVAIAIPITTAVVFFSQPRYLIPATAFLCILAGLGLAQLPKRWRTAGVVVAVVLSIAAIVPPLRNERGWFHPREHVGERAVGEWLAANTGPQDLVMTRSMVVEFYADRRTVAMPFDDLPTVLRFARHYGVRYVVATKNKLKALRPKLRTLLRHGPHPGLRLVFEDKVEGELVRVFALDPPPGDGASDAPGLGFTGDTAS